MSTHFISGSRAQRVEIKKILTGGLDSLILNAISFQGSQFTNVLCESSRTGPHVQYVKTAVSSIELHLWVSIYSTLQTKSSHTFTCQSSRESSHKYAYHVRTTMTQDAHACVNVSSWVTVGFLQVHLLLVLKALLSCYACCFLVRQIRDPIEESACTSLQS